MEQVSHCFRKPVGTAPPKKTSFPRRDVYLKYEPLQFVPFECIYPYEPEGCIQVFLLEGLYITKGMLIVSPLPEKTIFSGKNKDLSLVFGYSANPSI